MNLRESLTHNKVASLPLLAPLQVGPRGTVGEAIALMQTRREGCVVVAELGRPVGMFTERDVLKKVLARALPADTPIVDVMSRDPAVVQVDDSVAQVIRRMDAGGFRHVPVVDAAGRLQSVLSVKRIVEYLVEHFPRAVFNLPPEPDQKQTAREGA